MITAKGLKEIALTRRDSLVRELLSYVEASIRSVAEKGGLEDTIYVNERYAFALSDVENVLRNLDYEVGLYMEDLETYPEREKWYFIISWGDVQLG